MIKTVNVVMCPNCCDAWLTEDVDITKKECLCFKCGYKYIPEKIVKMWDFVYRAFISVKGH